MSSVSWLPLSMGALCLLTGGPPALLVFPAFWVVAAAVVAGLFALPLFYTESSRGRIGGLSSCSGRKQWHPLQCSGLENPRTEEPGGLQSMGSLRVGHD